MKVELGYEPAEETEKEESKREIFVKAWEFFRYDCSKFLSFGKRDELIFDELGTVKMVMFLPKGEDHLKAFIQLHFKKRIS